MGLTVEGTVILCGYKQSRSSASWVYDVLGMMLSLPPSQSVLSLLPPNLLCGKFREYLSDHDDQDKSEVS